MMEPEHKRKDRKDLYLERMFETRSQAWEKVGLAKQVSAGTVRRARRQAAALVPLLIAVLVAYAERKQILPTTHGGGCTGACQTDDKIIRIGTALVLVVLGWAFARDLGRAAAPTFFRRMDPGTAGTVGFLVRFATLAITGFAALRIAGTDPGTLAVGGGFTAVVLGLAAQQTLGNLFAGMVLLSARPFRVGERVRFQAGALAGRTEGVVSSLGLLYTTLARGEDRILIPNSVVLSSAVVPLREPEPVDVRVRLPAGIRPTHVQAMLDDGVGTPTRSEPRVLLEEINGDEVTVRVQATPEHANDGAALADEIIFTLAHVTGEHRAVPRDAGNERGREGSPRRQREDAGSHPPGDGQRLSR
jgi:small conductance mechanosensitive channel